MTHETCNSCKFWLETHQQIGQCRQYPPTSAGNVIGQVPGTVANPQGGHAPIPVFSIPDTDANFWCGEWAPRIVS